MKRILALLLCALAVLSAFTLTACKKNDEDGNSQNSTENTDPNYLPWENGGKAPAAYTWDEFNALSAVQQEAFVESFGSAEAFNKWEQRITGGSYQPSSEPIPWENGGKAPDEYTWAEFSELSAELQEAFAESFESAEAFEAWENSVLGDNQ